ncbi:MAG TPA: Gfo/Idh/MocA family oxidoreductase [Tepidisphaeraceae bacterium]|jgi:predicted dehydrogenase|nr:Gfo/Idh/MocA family oxidoreductase [Tepidisphaeraceae bacterium]
MKIRMIQAGLGSRGKAIIKSAAPENLDVEWVAVVDVVPAAVEEAGNFLNLPANRRFTSLAEAIAKVPADAVFCCAQPEVHHEHANLAFDNGLHFLTEKPISNTLERALDMVKLAEKTGKQLAVAQNYRYSPPMIAFRNIFAEKPVGEFGHGHLDFYIPADFTGTFREKMEFPLLVDMTIHHLDLIRAVTGRNIVKVTAHSFRPSWSWYEHDPALKMILELEGGLPFSYSGDWSGRGRTTSWNGAWRLQCADGSLHLEQDRIQSVTCGRWSKDPATRDHEIPDLEGNSERRILHEFAESVRTGKPMQVSGQDNLWSFAAVMAGVQSARQGQTVDVAELLGKA